MKRLLRSRMTSLIPSVLLGGFLCLSAQAAVILQEVFSDCTSMSGTTYTQGVAVRSNNAINNNLSGFGLGGWTVSSASVYCASNTVNGTQNYLIGLGTGSAMGWIETPQINLSGGGGDFTVTFAAGKWAVSENSGMYVEHWANSSLIDRYEITTLSDAVMQTFVVNGTNGTANSSIRFTARVASNNRFFLDNVLIEGETTTLNIAIAESAQTTLLAGQTATARIVAADSADPAPVEGFVDGTDIPGGNPYSFDGESFSWTPQVTGSFFVRFAASNQTDTVDCTLLLTVGLPAPNAPAVEARPNSLLLSWDPVPGATGYTVQVYQLAVEVDVFEEGFSGCTDTRSPSGTLVGFAGGNTIANNFSNFGLDGWTGYSAYSSYASNVVNNVTNYMVKFGTGSGGTNGWIQTPPMDLSGNGGEFTLTFRAAKWNTDTVNLAVSHIYDNGQETNTLATISSPALSGSTMTKYTVAMAGGTADSMICFASQSGGGHRFFLDDVKLSYVAAAKIEVPSSQITIDGTAARAFGLPSYSEYLCTVTALDGASETVSQEVPARTTASTLIIVR